MNHCIYCAGGPFMEWSSLKKHLKDCKRKGMVDTNRDEFKKAYGFWPDFDTVRDWIREVRGDEPKRTSDADQHQ